ncbi:putative erythropoiesis-stimulating protein [Streptomyces graminofaciens]|uniref:Erythropoiesis-stimulating protein n=1 Tax=Streptomyces graminofaciens TaxID=68212 RepID=A0ABM7FEK2_9ACTN|nr:LuxR family transcriptional regulator [Streptomyces graminofaciens]BBC34921.1 putative erythropoiesis-stimulating protein [Streptomyces graminofaciens]
MLTTLGLDAVAERVYRALLMRPQAGVAETAAMLGVPEAEVRDALDTLSELALVRGSAEDGGRPRAVSPDIGMEILMARQQAELAAQQQRLEASRAAAAQLISEYAELRPATRHPEVEQLVGLDQIRDRLAALTREVTEEFLAFAPGGPQTTDNMAASRPLNAALLGRRVRMRTVYLDSVRADRPTVEHARWLTSLGGQVRTVPSLPTRMIIMDRRTALIPVSSDDTSAGAVLLTGQGTLSALHALFETTWVAAQPLGDAVPVDAHGLTGQQATVVRLLAEGHTDDAIAKRLGVSPRTARRIASELMERLEARSRFEAGVRAVQHGWLPARV